MAAGILSSPGDPGQPTSPRSQVGRRGATLTHTPCPAIYPLSNNKARATFRGQHGANRLASFC